MSKYKKLQENFPRNYDFYKDLAMRESSGEAGRREARQLSWSLPNG